MDVTTNNDALSPPISVRSSVPESESNRSSISRRTSSGGSILRELESTGEMITRFELDIACVCEKLVNLNLLLMNVETKESDFEAFVSDVGTNAIDLDVKAMEFVFLLGFLSSEVREIETHICNLQIDKSNIWEFVSSRNHLGEALVGMKDMLRDSEKSLEQSLEQVLEIKVQSANLERNLLKFGREENGDDKDYVESSDNGDLPDLKEKVKMQTVEHQRHILRMLEKSLERELDYEQKLAESYQMEEALEMRLHSSEQEVLYAEEEAEMVLEKFYEADNTSELLMGVSKELLSQIQMLQFNLKGAFQREAELSSKLQENLETLKAKESAFLKLEKSNKESEVQMENTKASTEEIMEMEKTIKDLKQLMFEAETRAANAEAKYQSLIDTSNELKDASERILLLEKELSDTEIKLQNAEACVDASQEKQNMLNATIKDMENVIDDLKKKVSKAESRNESVEDKCIFLSETNAELKEELSFVKGKVESLEASLHRTEETRKETARDISLHTKLITDVVMQIALERERLHKQISSLKLENKILVKHLNKTEKGHDGKTAHGDKASSTGRGLFESDLTTMSGTTENREALSTSFQVDRTRDESVTDPTVSASEPPTERNIDPRVLRFKYILILFLGLMTPLFGIILHQIQDH